MLSIIIDKRYCGPPNSGNGGYVCGRLARHIPGGAEITLRTPPPLDTRLDVVATDDGLWELRDGALVVATGRPAGVAFPHLERARFDEARAAELLTPVKPHEHLLPTCFVCGPARKHGDGLRIFAGPVGRQSPNGSAVLAATWIPDSSLTGEDGLVERELLPRLRRFARTLARAPADADDLVQLTLERALTRRDQWRPGTRLDSWMFVRPTGSLSPTTVHRLPLGSTPHPLGTERVGLVPGR